MCININKFKLAPTYFSRVFDFIRGIIEWIKMKCLRHIAMFGNTNEINTFNTVLVQQLCFWLLPIIK